MSTPCHDAVLDTSGFTCRCIAALLFPLPHGCKDEHLLSSACNLGPRKGWHIPLLFCSCMGPFWPWAKPQPSHHEIPQHLRGTTLPAYASKDMQACGRFLRQHTKVKAWIDRRPAPEVIQWDHVQNKVHLEQGFAQAMDNKPTFWWDFDFGFW